MGPVVFIGPTISAAEVAAVLDAQCLPPAAQGDVYLATLKNPPAIGIIDGYFSGQAAVWHKEILWAISQGIPVFGASSMGALRAAELDAFGMVGVGEIYDSFAAGALEDDDEVAVVHAPPELGFAPLSEPMVNIRATLKLATEQGVLTEGERVELEDLAKSLNYAERKWERIADAASLSAKRWLTENSIDQKKSDALEMLTAVQASLGAAAERLTPEFSFERTSVWERAVRSWTMGEEPGDSQPILEEALVTGEAAELGRKALLRRLALADAFERDLEVSVSAQRQALKDFRMERSLLQSSSFEAWLADHSLTKDELAEALTDELFVAEILGAHAPTLGSHALDVLRLEGKFCAFSDRAARKRAWLEEKGLLEGALKKTGLMRRDLLTWFFEHRNNMPIPNDLESYSVKTGVSSADNLCEVIAREYLYLQSHDEIA